MDDFPIDDFHSNKEDEYSGCDDMGDDSDGDNNSGNDNSGVEGGDDVGVGLLGIA